MNKTYLNATAVLYSKTGKSMFKEQSTVDNVDDFMPSQETIDCAVRELTNLGISIRRVGGFGVSIKSEKDDFEKVFKTTLEEKTQNGSKYYVAKNELKMPDTLKPYVERIVLPIPPIFFER